MLFRIIPMARRLAVSAISVARSGALLGLAVTTGPLPCRRDCGRHYPPCAHAHRDSPPPGPRRPPCWPSVAHTFKRYLVARFRGQVEPLPETASAGASKEVVTQVVGSQVVSSRRSGNHQRR